MSDRCELRISATARKALSYRLPEAVAAAVWEFGDGPLRENPYRVGKPLDEPFTEKWAARRGTYRIFYEIDDDNNVVTVLNVIHRADAYYSS
jgi:mRNA interferase RelE/StbE